MSSFPLTRTRLLTSAASIVIGALSMTACGGGSGSHDEGRASSAASKSAVRVPAAEKSAVSEKKKEGTSGATATAASASGSGSNGSKSGGKAVTCQGSNTRTVASSLSRPLNHMLLTVTNTGSSTCYLYGYPALRFSEAQSVPPAIEDSHPQAVVTLDPGESGYASVGLSAGDGSGTNGRTVKSLTVYLQDRGGEFAPSGNIHPSLPADGVYIDDSLKVTYWQQALSDATRW